MSLINTNLELVWCLEQKSRFWGLKSWLQVFPIDPCLYSRHSFHWSFWFSSESFECFWLPSIEFAARKLSAFHFTQRMSSCKNEMPSNVVFLLLKVRLSHLSRGVINISSMGHIVNCNYFEIEEII